jgi:hypothetical protein
MKTVIKMKSWQKIGKRTVKTTIKVVSDDRNQALKTFEENVSAQDVLTNLGRKRA